MRCSLKTKISTPLLKETVEFYRRNFTMCVAEEWDSPNDRGAILAFDGPPREAYLEIYYSVAAHDFSGLSLQFRVDDLTAFMTAMDSSLAFDGPKKRPWGSTYLYLRDPNGIQIIVYEGGL